jgi:hypothetical protein
MSFCPVCGAEGQGVAARCERVARYYGYSLEQIAELALRGSSIAVPFFEIRRLFFSLEIQAQNPLARQMIDAVENTPEGGPAEEHGNLVRVLPFHCPERPDVREIFVKDDVSKTMVIYRHDDAIEHFGSEERAVLFGELAEQCFGLGACVPAVASGLSPVGTKYVVSAGLPRDRFLPLDLADGPRLRELWRTGVLGRVAILDLVLGQNDRNGQNVLLSRESPASLGLIDNDDSFGPHERLIDPFDYLVPLRDDPTVHFGGVRDWFTTLSLPDVVALMSRRALPREVVAAVCARFVFAAFAVQNAMGLADFMTAVFSGQRPVVEDLPGRPWVEYRSLVNESAAGTRYLNILGAELGDRCFVWTFEGRALDQRPATVRLSCVDPKDAQSIVDSLTRDAASDGFTNLMRRRFFVDDDVLRIVEIRADPAGWHVLVRRGRLSHYGDKIVEKFVSLSSAADALASANQVEAALLAAGSIDLRARLAAFKTAGVGPTFF